MRPTNTQNLFTRLAPALVLGLSLFASACAGSNPGPAGGIPLGGSNLPIASTDPLTPTPKQKVEREPRVIIDGQALRSVRPDSVGPRNVRN